MKHYPVSQPCFGINEFQLVEQVMRSGWLTQGPVVEKFEQILAEFLDVDYVVACSSGTTALHLALAAAGIGPGDEVLVPDITFVATANAVVYTGAKPVLVDVDVKTWTIDISKIEEKITTKTRAIIPVHLYGSPCDMTNLLEMARNYKLIVIEDAAEAFAGFWDGTALGTLGNAGIFSFYANKILATGEGGAVATDSSILAKQLKFLRGQAQTERRYYHSSVGFNYRMTELQAAIGLGQMKHIADMIKKRHLVCDIYRKRLGYLPYMPLAGDSPWLFTVLLPDDRNLLASSLAKRDIETRPTFVPLHRLPMFIGLDKDFPVASLIGDTGLSLPTYPDLNLEDVEGICDIVLEEMLCLPMK